MIKATVFCTLLAMLGCRMSNSSVESHPLEIQSYCNFKEDHFVIFTSITSTFKVSDQREAEKFGAFEQRDTLWNIWCDLKTTECTATTLDLASAKISYLDSTVAQGMRVYKDRGGFVLKWGLHSLIVDSSHTGITYYINGGVGSVVGTGHCPK